MSDQEADFGALVSRFSGLGRADRKAVLESFSTEERMTFEAALAAEEQERAAEEERQRQADRQFLGYSPWLAKLVEPAVKTGETSLAPETAKAVAAEHKALLAAKGSGQNDGWRGAVGRIREILLGTGASVS